MPRRRPVAVTIEQRPDDPAIENAGKCLVFRLRFPFRHDFIAAAENCEYANRPDSPDRNPSRHFAGRIVPGAIVTR